MADMFTVKGEGLTVELILHRLYGVRGRDVVAETLRLNPSLASLGPFLPLGVSFYPADLPRQSAVVKPRKSLFRDA